MICQARSFFGRLDVWDEAWRLPEALNHTRRKSLVLGTGREPTLLYLFSFSLLNIMSDTSLSAYRSTFDNLRNVGNIEE